MRHRCYRRLNQKGLEKSLIRAIALTPSGIVTTISKAKFLKKIIDKIITLAKKYLATNQISYFRDLIAKSDLEVAQKIIKDIAPNLKDGGGYSRVIKLCQPRFGDSVKTACISIVGFEKNLTTEVGNKG
jgi:large subunit ribosomal protein L17